MSINLIQKSIIPLIFATLFVGGFFWQFIKVYPFLIEKFTEDKLSTLYSHLFIYSFLSLILFTSLINFFNHFFLKSKLFIGVVLLPITLFYLLSYSSYVKIFDYFLNYFLSQNIIQGIILFVLLSFIYVLYSLSILFLNKFIPLLSVFIFSLLGMVYSILFIDNYCYPIRDILIKF